MRARLSVFLIAIAFMGCKSTAEVNGSADTNTADTVVVMVEKPVMQRDSLAISFEKTPCFGKCPVYKIKVYESGFAVYEGINFSERMGLYATRLSKEKMERIYQSAIEIGFFELDDTYDNPLVSDLPSTRTTIKMNGKAHSVMARHNAPEKLHVFQENLSVTLSENSWKPYSNR